MNINDFYFLQILIRIPAGVGLGLGKLIIGRDDKYVFFFKWAVSYKVPSREQYPPSNIGLGLPSVVRSDIKKYSTYPFLFIHDVLQKEGGGGGEGGFFFFFFLIFGEKHKKMENKKKEMSNEFRL